MNTFQQMQVCTKKILRNISHQSISHRKVQESKYLSGTNHSACHIVEVKTMRTSGGEDPHVLNAQAISVIFKLPISAKSRVQVIFSSQYESNETQPYRRTICVYISKLSISRYCCQYYKISGMTAGTLLVWINRQSPQKFLCKIWELT